MVPGTGVVFLTADKNYGRYAEVFPGMALPAAAWQERIT